MVAHHCPLGHTLTSWSQEFCRQTQVVFWYLALSHGGSPSPTLVARAAVVGTAGVAAVADYPAAVVFANVLGTAAVVVSAVAVADRDVSASAACCC